MRPYLKRGKSCERRLRSPSFPKSQASMTSPEDPKRKPQHGLENPPAPGMMLDECRSIGPRSYHILGIRHLAFRSGSGLATLTLIRLAPGVMSYSFVGYWQRGYPMRGASSPSDVSPLSTDSCSGISLQPPRLRATAVDVVA